MFPSVLDKYYMFDITTIVEDNFLFSSSRSTLADTYKQNGIDKIQLIKEAKQKKFFC